MFKHIHSTENPLEWFLMHISKLATSTNVGVYPWIHVEIFVMQHECKVLLTPSKTSHR